jgi:hypothetical protein
MQKTVREIIDMIDNDMLHHDQSTQRDFIYASIQVPVRSGGRTTRTGSLMHSILELGIKRLPAVYFWYNTDTQQLNIHDGKQRILSFYYFIKGVAPYDSLTTIRNNRKVLFSELPTADREKLLNFTLDIVECSGTSAEEEDSFVLLNNNVEPLTRYEMLSGIHYGKFMDEFENYLALRRISSGHINPIGRGEQAYKFLLAVARLHDAKKAAGEDATFLSLSNWLLPHRYLTFDPTAWRFDEVLDVYIDLMSIKGLNLKEDNAIQLARLIVDNNWPKTEIIKLYMKCAPKNHDIPTWSVKDTHTPFIEYFVSNGCDLNVHLDPLRNFSRDVRTALEKKGQWTCQQEGCTEEHNLEIDHIFPWCKGGRTVESNAQLLCKKHNAGKNDTILPGTNPLGWDTTITKEITEND